MAEKRKLLAEIDKCFKKIDEGVELFEETMNKMQDANSDNQREKYQDDLKKEIKKLQRLREQVKGWQNCSDVKDKDKLSYYRKVIESKMEQFKDIERENKTKPHSKQGLNAEEKLDPRAKEKSDAIEWLQSQIRELDVEADRTESQMEMTSTDAGKRRGKKDDAKEKKMEELKRHLERMKFHIGKLEICMRLVNNESLDPKRALEVLKEPYEMYIEALGPDSGMDLETYDPEEYYDELELASLSAQLVGVGMGSMDDERHENGHDNCSNADSEELKHSTRHGSTDAPSSPASRRTVAASPATPAKLQKENSIDGGCVITSIVSPVTPPPAPPVMPYNSVAAGRTSVVPTVSTPLSKQPNPPSSSPRSSGAGSMISVMTSTSTQGANDENQIPAEVPTKSEVSVHTSVISTAVEPKEEAMAARAAQHATALATSQHTFAFSNGSTSHEVAAVSTTTDSSTLIADMTVSAETNALNKLETSAPFSTNTVSISSARHDASLLAEDAALRSLRICTLNQQPVRAEPQTAKIPPWLGASPLGRTAQTPDMDTNLSALDAALTRTPLPLDSERPRTYLPKIVCPCAAYYPQVHNTPVNGDTLEYYLRLSPETLFFIFYYMEGTRAQLLAAKALKKLSWRFHTKYLTWFQRHEEPKQITDDYEQGTYVYFDFEKWSQRKKEAFTFEYRYLEDKEFD